MTDKQRNRMLQVDNRFITTIGINPGILLSELLDKENHCIEEKLIDKEGYFFHEKKHIYIRTALTRDKFDSARKKLEKIKILKTKLWKGKKLYFKIDDYEFSKFIYPNANDIISKKIIHEELTKEGYFMYNIWLAHRIGINETILLTDLISKRNYFSIRWELINGFFFNSISNIEKTTSLSKAKQIISTKNLEKENLIQLEIINNNTRYFSLNDEKIEEYKQSNYEKFLKLESGKSHTSESSKSHGSKLLINKFEKLESGKSNTSESSKSHSIESWKYDTLKVEKQIARKENIKQIESWKQDTNNNYIIKSKEKEIKNNNEEEKIRSLLFKYFKKNKKEDVSQVERIIKLYSFKRINEVIKELNKKPKDESKVVGFIIWALDKNKFINEKIKHTKSKDEIIKEQKELEKNKINNSLKKRINEWKKENKEYYDKIYEKIEKNLISSKEEAILKPNLEVSTYKLNIITLIKTKEYITNNILE